MSEKKRVTWFQYLDKVHRLIELVKEAPVKYEAILGVTRGGLLPAVWMSHELGIPMYPVEAPYFETKEYMEADKPPRKALLVVDDFYDTGKTLTHCKHDIAVMWNKTWSPVKPEVKYVVETEDCWLVMPYEKD